METLIWLNKTAFWDTCLCYAALECSSRDTMSHGRNQHLFSWHYSCLHLMQRGEFEHIDSPLGNKHPEYASRQAIGGLEAWSTYSNDQLMREGQMVHHKFLEQAFVLQVWLPCERLQCSNYGAGDNSYSYSERQYDGSIKSRLKTVIKRKNSATTPSFFFFFFSQLLFLPSCPPSNNNDMSLY